MTPEEYRRRRLRRMNEPVPASPMIRSVVPRAAARVNYAPPLTSQGVTEIPGQLDFSQNGNPWIILLEDI